MDGGPGTGRVVCRAIAGVPVAHGIEGGGLSHDLDVPESRCLGIPPRGRDGAFAPAPAARLRPAGGSWGGGALVSGDGSRLVIIDGESNSSSSNIVFSDNVARCGDDQANCVATGGAIASGDAASVQIIGCELTRNRANQGGAVSVFGSKSKVMMNGTSCRANVVEKADAQNVQVRGGCLFGTDTSEIIIANRQSSSSSNSSNNIGSVISSNMVNGNGNGGGISIQGNAKLFASDGTIIRYNEAADGGGIRAGESSIATCRGCSLYGNKASFVGGAVRVDERASLVMDGCWIHHNIAPQATAIWGSGENNHFDLSNSIVVEEPGNIVTLVGSRVERNVTWNCTAQNSIMESETSDSKRLTHSCVVCGVGTYSIGIASSLRPDKRSCFACPVGGICGGGRDINNETARVVDIRRESIGCLSQPGYWGHPVSLNANANNNSSSIDGSISFYLCPSGYCCPPNQIDGCDYDYCRGNRTGRLCGNCVDGMGQRLFSDACFDNSSCNDMAWFVPLIFVLLLCLALILVWLWGGRGSEGIDMVVLFFYQVN